jgi:ComF family protein
MSGLKAMAGITAQQVMNIILPPRCILSGEIVDQPGMLAPHLWSELEFIADPSCSRCGYPFDFDVEKGAQCTECMQDPPPYTAARSPLRYSDTSRNLVLGFKHADKLHAVTAFVPWLARAGAPLLTEADYLVPVPLHRWRLMRRRYNQASVIAKALGRHCDLPVLADGLARVRHTPSQGHLDIKDRARNVRSAFAVKDKHKAALRGKTVVLIDDVYTTGATVKECTRIMLKAGVQSVHVLTLARVVKD